MPVTVLLVDDHALIREGLRRAFEQTDDLEVVGEASGVDEAAAMVRATTPDVAVVDVNLGDGNGIDLVRRLRAEYPRMGLVVCTMYEGDEHMLGALEAGASGFVLKSAPADEVVAAARQAAVSPTSFTANDLAGAMRRRMLEPRVRLTPREHEILQHLADGVSVAVLAQRLYISQSTAKTHMSKLYEKLGAQNRTQAIMAAVRLGLVKADATR
ncbi:MAG TPA: response regulator transcription factor [Mycobacteriales bacterium]|nr:response regulator transcription factor [Mycobacteriales bacterium]